MLNARIYIYLVGVICTCLVFSGCGGNVNISSQASAPRFLLPTVSPANTFGPCHYSYVNPSSVLPDGNCTPGVIDPQVTQDNVQSTICRSGYTKTVRPPANYTDELKYQQLVEYGLAHDLNEAKRVASSYEEDHLIALEIGGNALDAKNLWPELRNSNNALLKDKVENEAKYMICRDGLSLADAQQRMAINWYDLGRALGTIK